jgi:hypothetical protein
MASGHVNRTNRPNTWLHRPSLQREDFPCQLGAVHMAHIAALDVCDAMSAVGESGRRIRGTFVGQPTETCFQEVWRPSYFNPPNPPTEG